MVFVVICGVVVIPGIGVEVVGFWASKDFLRRHTFSGFSILSNWFKKSDFGNIWVWKPAPVFCCDLWALAFSVMFDWTEHISSKLWSLGLFAKLPRVFLLGRFSNCEIPSVLVWSYSRYFGRRTSVIIKNGMRVLFNENVWKPFKRSFDLKNSR